MKKRGRSQDSEAATEEEKLIKPCISHHDHYKVLERVGEGTYGVVTKAYERSTGNLVALKKIRTAGSVDGLPATSLREIKLLKSLGHPHIIKLNSVFHESMSYTRFSSSRFLGAQGARDRPTNKTEAGALLLEFDYLECDLRKFMKHFPLRRIPLAVVKLIMYQLFDALHYIHSNQVIHRDIKPSNVLVNFEPKSNKEATSINLPASLSRRRGCGRRVTKEESFRTSILQSIDNYVSAHQLNGGSASIKLESRIETNLVNLMMSTISVKLADFGLARVYPCPARPLTHEVVTLWYRAPEVVLGYEYYNTSLDIWSMGCIMLELLYGRPVILGDSEAETMFKIFQLLGTPTNDDFVSELPHFQKQWPVWARRKDRYDFLRTPEEIDDNCKSLLDSLLQYAPDQRATAMEAMSHAWFDDIRKNV